MNKTPKTVYRDEHLHMRIPSPIKHMLQELASEDSMTMSEWIVLQIRAEYGNRHDIRTSHNESEFGYNPYQE